MGHDEAFPGLGFMGPFHNISITYKVYKSSVINIFDRETENLKGPGKKHSGSSSFFRKYFGLDMNFKPPT